MVGLVLLTLSPGEIGGSETYVRGLARALAARGHVPVTAYVSRAAADAGEGLPTDVVDEYPIARSRRGRAFIGPKPKGQTPKGVCPLSES